MLGRRKHVRFLLSEPVTASLRLREEVTIERWDQDEVVVLSPEPIKPEERLTLEIPGQSHRRVHVRVLDSRPAVVDDTAIRHRLRLGIDQPAAEVAHIGGSEP
jgi:hypothetical protein